MKIHELLENIDRKKMHYKDVTKRVPELTAAAQKIQSGEMSWQEYQELVNKHKPVEPYAFIPKPASTAAMQRGLDIKKIEKINQPVEDGTPVLLRLDIPAYKDHGVWVPTVHNSNGKTIRHGSTSIINNITIKLPTNAALNIATGKKNKSPIATLAGNWENATPKDAYRMANHALKDPSWIQVGMDPERHSYFYDRKTQQPVIGGDRVIQVGGVVLLKNPKYDDPKHYPYEESLQESLKSVDQDIIKLFS
jgi:hypothetical protein